MNIVQPIRDKEMIDDMKKSLKATKERNYIMFLLGIYTAMRISDILMIRVKDVEGQYITVREKKTKKFKRVFMNHELRLALHRYVKDMEPYEYLIKSREGKNKPISRGMAYKILKELALEYGLDSIGTHSLRKTFGYWFYKNTKDVATLQKILNHTDQKETLRYIGIEQENIDDMMRRFKI